MTICVNGRYIIERKHCSNRHFLCRTAEGFYECVLDFGRYDVGFSCFLFDLHELLPADAWSLYLCLFLPGFVLTRKDT